MTELTRKERQQRIKTIELLNPEFIREMKLCAGALGFDFDEFVGVLERAVEDDSYYESMGANQSYDEYDWNKIWVGYELLTGTKVPPNKWGGPRVPFSCSC